MADEPNTTQTTEQSPAQTPEGAENSGGSGLTFDQWLDSNPAYRSEFDRRATKAVQTARTKWEQEQAENLTEAERRTVRLGPPWRFLRLLPDAGIQRLAVYVKESVEERPRGTYPREL